VDVVSRAFIRIALTHSEFHPLPKNNKEDEILVFIKIANKDKVIP